MMGQNSVGGSNNNKDAKINGSENKIKIDPPNSSSIWHLSVFPKNLS